MKKIAIMGAGALGGYIGAFLTREGEDVLLIDQWPEHVATMQQKGLRVTGTDGEFTVPVKAMHLHEAQSIHERFDIAFVSVKSYDTEWATHFIKRYVKPTGLVISAQNGMNDELIASIVGYEREMGCVVSHIRVHLTEPGHIVRGSAPGRGSGHTIFRVGELHGRITPRAQEVGELLEKVDSTIVTSNLWGERWSKLSVNCMANPVTAMSTFYLKSTMEMNRARFLQIHLVREAVLVGQALHYPIEAINGFPPEVWARANEGDVLEEIDSQLVAKAEALEWPPSTAQDVMKGRRSETDYLNGHVVEKGGQVGVPTPVNAAVVAVLRDIDARRLKPDVSNIERTLQMAGL